MGSPEPTPNVSIDEVRGMFSHAEEPVRPLSTRDAAEALECSHQIAYQYLEELAEQGELKTKVVDDSSRIWWKSEGDLSGGQRSDEEQLSSFVRAVKDYAIFMLEPEGIVASWNEGAERIKGYSKDEIVGEHFSEFYTDDDIADGVPKQNLEVARSEGRVEDEGWRIHKDGSRFWANVTITAIRDDDGRLQGFTKVTRDMTKRRKYEQQLTEQAEQLERQRDELENELEDIFERIDDAFYALDDKFQFEYVNERAETHLGKPAEELLGRNVWDTLDVDETDPIIEKYETALATQEPTSFERYSEPLEMWETVRVYPSESGLSVYFRDIADRKERERELERTRELLEKTERIADVGGWEIDRENHEVFWSDHVFEILGIPSEEEPPLEEALDVYHEDDRPIVENAVEGTLDSGESFDVEVRFRRPSGEVRWLHVKADPHVENGEIVSVRGAVQDITERKEREQELQRREQQYRTLAESFPNGAVTMLDTEHRFTLAAGQVFDELPVSASGIEGQTIEEAWGQEVASTVEPAYEDALAGEERIVEVDYVDRDWRIYIVPIRDESDTVFAAMAMAQDITEQKERERFLEDAKAQLEAATEAGAIGTWEWYVPEDRFVAGTSLAKQFGVDPDRAREGVSLDQFLSSIHEDDRERVEAKVEEALESCGEYEAEYRTHTATGEVRWVIARGHVECDEDGNPVRFPGALTDITDRKEYQQRLEETISKLEASNERLEQFAYAASHDLQEPLRMISSYLKLIEQRYEDDLDEDGEEFLEFAINGADRMRSMIEGLLDYSRVETRGEPLEPVALEAVFEDVRDDLAIQIKKSNADITADSLPRVQADQSQLRQLFQNLLDNAITYSGDEPPQIHVSAERDRSEWVISVRDEGIGINSDDQERIFDVFHRLHNREEYPGSGIGLALCERILERHGGDIWVESEPGEGSTFSFTLPSVENSPL